MNEECQEVVVISIALVTGSLYFNVEVLACIMEFNACKDISICSFFDLFYLFIDYGIRVYVGSWRGFKFSAS